MSYCAPVYVVDDDPAMLELTQFLLSSLGVDSKAFAEPLSFLQNIHDLEPGCVLTDLSMPSMTGVELHAALLAKGIDWPLVLMSGNRDRRSSRAFVKDGLSGFIEKPFTIEQLLAVLETAFQALADKCGREARRA